MVYYISSFSIWPLMKNLSLRNSIGWRVIQKSVATKEWMQKTEVIAQNAEKLRMVRIGFAVLSAGFGFMKIAFMPSLICSGFC